MQTVNDFAGGVPVIGEKQLPESLAQQKITREVMMRMLLTQLQQNPEFLGAWSAWEPGAFDDNDADYANAPGHDEQGRFLPYYYRGSGEIVLKHT